jgi:hypothetical protein
MKKKELQHRYYLLNVTCGINQRYHNLLQWRFSWLDRILKIAVGFLATFGLILACPGMDWPPLGLVVAFISLVVAIALNVIPVGEWDKRHLDLFRQWSTLRKEAEVDWNKTDDIEGEDPEITKTYRDRIIEITNREHDLHAAEPSAWRKLLARCQEDENESRFGKGLRTPEDIKKERERRTQCSNRLPKVGAVQAVAPQPDK